jgi:hypothetical protein
MDDWYCSERSLSADEPLEGTAAGGTEHFVALEHDGPYGPKGVEDSGLPPEVVEHLGGLTKRHPHVRVQLIRRPSGRRGGPALYLSGGPEGSERLLKLVLADALDVLRVDFETWLGGATPAGASVCSEPLFLVCVHGRRDRCCARRGMPVYSALEREAPELTYQTTHLGGHRFAATLVVLPQGYCYGRVEPEECAQLVSAHRTGTLHDLARLRGRMRYSGAVQSAEIALRRSLSLHAVDALRFESAEEDEGHVRAVFREVGRGVTHTIRVRKEPLPPIAASCGADPKPGEAWVELRLH